MNETQAASDKTLPMVVYALYLASLVVGITSLIGVVMAYVNQGSAPAWLHSHYRFQIRTFWIGLLYSVVGILTAVIGIGVLVLLFVVIWLIVRCVKGMMYLNEGKEHPDPGSWIFG